MVNDDAEEDEENTDDDARHRQLPHSRQRHRCLSPMVITVVIETTVVSK